MRAPRRSSLSPLSGLVLVLLFLLAGTVGATSVRPVDWPQHRGPHQSGVLEVPGVFDRPEFGLAVAWKRSLGSGYSGIAVVDGTAVTMTSDGTDDVVVAFDAASGEERWRHRLAETYRGHTGSDDGPISTPTVADGVVYGLGPRGQLFALRLADGSAVWTRTLDGETESRAPFYGYSTSPVVAGDTLVVLTGGPAGNTIRAYRRGDGEPTWHWGDDTVSYQTPILVELGGRAQLVAATNHFLVGLDPASGERLWEHRHTEADGDGFGQPVAMGDGRFLLNFWEEAVAYGVEPATDGEGATTYEVAELWRSNQLRNSYGIPVYDDGQLYGWSGRFLSAVDAADGTSLWKSRPPGGRNHILVDGHLVVVTEDGEVVVAEASSEGYRERARIAALDGPTHTAASFAGGRLYVRDLTSIAAVDVTADRTADLGPPPAPAPPELPTSFAAFVAKVEAAPATERKALVDAWMAAQKSFPVVGEDGHVVFVYRGEAQDVAVTGSAFGFGFPPEERPLFRLADTDLFYTAAKLDPRSHYEYRYNVDYGNVGPDPRNPLEVGSIFGPSSELRMPGWSVPDHLAEPTGERGRIDTFTLASAIRGDEREVKVYLPPGYDVSGDREYPLMIVNHGPLALEQKLYDRALDNLIAAGRIEPVVGVFLARVGPDYGPAIADYARFVAEELLPEVDRRYRLSDQRSDRAVTGVGSGAYAAAYVAFAAPERFGKVATQSFYLPAESDLMERVAAAEQDLQVYVELTDHDYLTPPQLDARKDSLALAAALEAEGHEVVRHQTYGAAGAGHWRAQDDDILELFFPAGD